jgi:hypothetical protein
MFLQQEIYPTNDRSVPPQAGDLELLEGARLSKQIAARAQVSSWQILLQKSQIARPIFLL